MVTAKNDGNVILGFLGQDVAVVEFPEIGVAGALHRSLHRAGAGVVRGHGEIPVAKLVVEIFQVAGGGAGGFLGVLAVVDPHVVVKARTAAAAAHELPDAASARPRNRQRMESGLGLRQIDQILRHAFLFQSCHDHVVVAAGAGKGALEVAPSAIAREIGDVAGDLIGHHQRQVGMGVCLISASALARTLASAAGARPLVASLV
jgi:hypothetical protein